MHFGHKALELANREFPASAVGAAMKLISAGDVQLFSELADTGVREFNYTVLTDRSIHDVNLAINADGTTDIMCSCGASRCAHLAAGVLLAFSADAKPVPSWHKELAPLLPTSTPAPESCLFITLVDPTRSRYSYGAPRSRYIGIRPGILGSRGLWIKGNTSWRNPPFHQATPRQASAVNRLQRLWESTQEHWYYDPEWIPLGNLPGEDLWATLIRIRDSGIPIVSTGKHQHPLVFEDTPINVSVTLARHGSSLRLAATTSDPPAPDGSQTIWLGEPHAVRARVIDAGAPGELISLARVGHEIDRVTSHLLQREAALTIPASDIASFEAEFLPRIQAGTTLISPDGSYDLPEPPRNVLTLTLHYADPQLHLSWQWRRPSGIADAGHEHAVTEEVNALLAELPNAPTAHDIPADRILGAAASVLFVTEILPKIRELDDIEIIEQSAPPEYRAARENALVSAELGHSGDWFDLHFTVTVDEEPVDFADLFTALSLDDPIFVLPSGTYFPLDGPEFQKLREIIEEARALGDRPVAQSDSIRVNRSQLDLWNDLAELGVVAAREAEWWLAVQSLADGEGVSPVDPPSTLQATLRDYQQLGFSWLHFLRTHGLGGILADDMGLGKTLQTIAMLETARVENPDMKPFLVVAPTSVVANWASECARFAPELKIAIITAMESRRGERLADAVAGAHVVITSYTLFRSEAEQYRALEWSGLILDEAQRIKNAASHGYRAARDLGAPFCLVITGTPLENNLGELWALAALAAPGLLGSQKKFTEFYRKPIEKLKDADRLALLQRRLRPFLLRRTKELVATELPPKQEQVLSIELHPKHRRLYDVRFQRERQKVLGLVDDVEANRFQIFRSLMLLRQLALDPSLVDEGEAPSAKLEALEELIVEAAEEGHRVLVLSQFTQFLGAARDHISAAGIPSQYLDGKTTNRPAVISRFREGTEPVFFVSLHAGGVGLNLVEADYVVLLDPWWNPAVEAQAIDRAHRIGQTRPVIVYRLVAKDTIEQKVIALRESKAELFARVLDGEGEFTPGTLTAEDVRGLLG
ncbi:DEAD/DEAH box helicase [Microbacterium sp.]|uniref:DEAD/DEAH box helicase n=1 Tax=Microbacterium sp. TaxID=51671 RepID=UPI0039E3B9BE